MNKHTPDSITSTNSESAQNNQNQNSKTNPNSELVLGKQNPHSPFTHNYNNIMDNQNPNSDTKPNCNSHSSMNTQQKSTNSTYNNKPTLNSMNNQNSTLGINPQGTHDSQNDLNETPSGMTQEKPEPMTSTALTATAEEIIRTEIRASHMTETANSEEDTPSSSRISIKMKFRPSKKEGSKGVVYIQLIQDRNTSKVNTPYHIFPSEWDKSISEIVIPEVDSERTAELRSIAADLKWDMSILERLSLDNKNKGVKSLIAAYQNFKALGEGSLFEYMRRHINRLKEEGRLRAAETFLCTLNSFIRFRGGMDLSFEMITRSQMESYQQYLKESDLTMNTISFYMRKLRAVYNKAVAENLCQDTKPFATVYTANAPTKKRAINRSILRKIAGADLSDEPKLEFARDMFLLLIYLQGISFVDLAHMRNIDDDTELLTYNRHKTGSPISIFLEKEARDIINKYKGGENSPYLLAILNSTDKKKARQEYLNALARINYALEKLADRLGLNIHITTYVARHSWATMALANGANLYTISQALGHKDLKTTRIYIDSIHSDAVTKANRGVMDSLKGEE